jgi:hypothetical protein
MESRKNANAPATHGERRPRPAQRGNDVADPRHAERVHGDPEALHEGVDLEVQRARELNVRRQVAHRDDLERSYFRGTLGQDALCTPQVYRLRIDP